MKRRDLLWGAGALALVGGSAAAISFYQTGSSEAYEAAALDARSTLAQNPDLKDLVRYATLAANGHNTQPWRFHLTDGRIEIRPDLSRRTPVVDADDHHLFVSLGCAAENLSLAAQARGMPGDVRFDPAGEGAVTFDYARGAAVQSVLFDAIPKRQSTRSEYDGRAVTADDLKALADAAAVPGVDVKLITDKPGIARVRDVVVAANSVQMAQDGFMPELKSWLRFNPRAAMSMRDGLFTATGGNPAIPSWLGPIMLDLTMSASSENDRYSAQMISSSGIAVFTAEKADHEHWVLAGRACQRFTLQATALGMKVAYMNQPVEVESFRPELASLIGLPGRRPDIVIRFGYAPALPYSLRRPVEAVLV
ncbi:Acg family FMN-binding oxidoreductase [Rhizobium sp. C4]|uniref:Acg family FMN-binding oxidoreductase n=1 Tax=Rhizobium sp. C4 TaxID=1349800 RepID=UPI001E5099C2|nr:nitroreductase family protein [Rhizobium sp. C4]MCD2171451.1 nitroreductase family protein [Rhizobium sp. C4]